MKEFAINREQARVFVFECFESIINDIKTKENKVITENSSEELSYEISVSGKESK